MSRLSPAAVTAENVARFHWSRAIRIRLERERIISDGIRVHGEAGPVISGCYQSHWPEETRYRLRGLAHAWAIENQAGFDALAKTRRRRSTILRMRDAFETLNAAPGYLFHY